jgi:uncharacterized protein (TIGR00299 family) protein
MSRRSSTGSSGRPRAGKRAAADAAAGGRVLHLDTFSGVAGNMFLGALLDAGLSRRELAADLKGLGLKHSLRVSRVKRGALSGCYVDVRVPASSKGKTSSAATRKGRPPRAKSVSGGHHHGAVHDHGHSAGHTHDHGHAERSYSEVCRILERAKLLPEVRDRSLEVFEALARAEARVHGTKLEEVHFHEVGAVDAIVDIAGSVIGLQRLGIRHVSCTPIALGHGTVETAHGVLPLPAPATLELLKGLPCVPTDVPWETVTPTGAALVRVCVDEFRQLPAMTVESIGYGAGGDRKGPMPNLLRAVVGRVGGPDWDRVVALETNLDDLVPEHFDYLMERLFDAGALEVALQHLQMKKNRPGFLVRVLARPSERLALTQILFAESTAIGVRSVEWDRLVLQREEKRVATPFGRIRVKLIRGGGAETMVSPEYDDCKAAARRSGAPLREVVRTAEAIARKAFGET